MMWPALPTAALVSVRHATVGQYRSVAGDRFPAVSLEPMKPTTSDAGQSPLLLFRDLLATLCAEGGQNWAPGVQAIVQALTPPFASEQEQFDTIAEARRRFEALLGGKGGLSEFYIARASFAEQTEANAAFDVLKARILAA
jgi:hypothetical protein